MPPSVRFILLLLVLGAVSAPVSYYVQEYQDETQARTTAEQLTGGSVDVGERAMLRYGCGSCHEIRDLAGATGAVGPALDKIAGRTVIAGRLANTPANMVLWLRSPQHVVPGNAMPDQGVTQREARDIAAYLYTLK